MKRGGLGRGTRKIRIRSGTRSYRCSSCGFVYSPLTTAVKSGVPAGTRFEALPEEWTCPCCGREKGQFLRTAPKRNT